MACRTRVTCCRVFSRRVVSQASLSGRCLVLQDHRRSGFRCRPGPRRPIKSISTPRFVSCSDSRFTTWLYSITRNHCLDQLRSQSLHPAEAADSSLDEIADGSLEEFSVTMERRQSEEMVRQLIRESLDETETRIMTLHYVDELPLEAITRLIGLTNQSGAKAYIVSARRKLSRSGGEMAPDKRSAKGASMPFWILAPSAKSSHELWRPAKTARPSKNSSNPHRRRRGGRGTGAPSGVVRLLSG